jgi:hypothetical protein
VDVSACFRIAGGIVASKKDSKVCNSLLLYLAGHGEQYAEKPPGQEPTREDDCMDEGFATFSVKEVGGRDGTWFGTGVILDDTVNETVATTVYDLSRTQLVIVADTCKYVLHVLMHFAHLIFEFLLTFLLPHIPVDFLQLGNDGRLALPTHRRRERRAFHMEDLWGAAAFGGRLGVIPSCVHLRPRPRLLVRWRGRWREGDGTLRQAHCRPGSHRRRKQDLLEQPATRW